MKLRRYLFDQNLAQLSKLNLKGETKTKYDAMKKDNVESTNKYLAPVEEKIHNAEALLDRNLVSTHLKVKLMMQMS